MRQQEAPKHRTDDLLKPVLEELCTEDTLVMGWDHFTAAAHTMKNKSNKVYYTLFTFGWYTNNDDGKLSLTVPQRSILLI